MNNPLPKPSFITEGFFISLLFLFSYPKSYLNMILKYDFWILKKYYIETIRFYNQ